MANSSVTQTLVVTGPSMRLVEDDEIGRRMRMATAAAVDKMLDMWRVRAYSCRQFDSAVVES